MKQFVLYAAIILSATGCSVNFEDLKSGNLFSGSDTENTEDAPKNFLEQRAEFRTQITSIALPSQNSAAWPPESDFESVLYDAENGKQMAYLSPDPGDGKKHPAVLWAKSGFEGIGSFLWEESPASNDRSVRAFLDADIITMCPSWRGENTNPGRFELFYGEVEDLLDALAYLKNVPYVDPERIYLIGHSSGGTLALLAAVATDEFRAIFSLGGAPDVGRIVGDGKGYGNTPFDYYSDDETRLRNAFEFVHEVKTPTFYFEGRAGSLVPGTTFMSNSLSDAQKLGGLALAAGVPLEVHLIKNGNHSNFVQYLTRRIARKIDEDRGLTCNIKINQYDVRLPRQKDSGGILGNSTRQKLGIR